METGLSAEVKALMKANGGDLFYDSHSSDRGSPDELWTNQMGEEFAKRRSYPLIPNLPALFREFFDFSDGSAPRVRNDFYAVRGDLWIEKQLQPLRAWARKYNNVLRVQVEGEANLIIPITDMVQATAAVDRPEHENLFVGDEIDNYLPMASANHMTGNPWYSTECCAALNKSYAQTFQDTIIRMHRSFVGRHHQARLSRLSVPRRPHIEVAGISQLRPDGLLERLGSTRALLGGRPSLQRLLRAKPAGADARRRQDRRRRVHAELSVSAVAGHQDPALGRH